MTKHPLSPDEIAAIPLDRPELLFSGDPAALKREWRALAAEWHPDRHAGAPAATAVLQHINALHGEAERRLDAGFWETAHVLRMRSDMGRDFELKFRRRGAFELGESFIGPDRVAYLVSGADRDLVENAVRALGRFTYPDAAMRTEIAPRLPRMAARFEAKDRLVLVLRKPADQVRLADLTAHLGGKLPPHHVAWVLGRLLGLACYFECTGIVHGAIGPDSVFVGPREHSVSLIGGWWYATKDCEAPIAVPTRTVGLLSPTDAALGIVSGRIDRELIRLTAREVLGDPAGTRLLRDPAVPPAFAEWLVQPPPDSALDDYRSFEAAREAAFGPPRFVDLLVDFDDVYPQP